jgi:hypothetical protein
MEKLCVDFEGKKRQMRLTINSHYEQKFILKIIHWFIQISTKPTREIFNAL